MYVGDEFGPYLVEADATSGKVMIRFKCQGTGTAALPAVCMRSTIVDACGTASFGCEHYSGYYPEHVLAVRQGRFQGVAGVHGPVTGHPPVHLYALGLVPCLHLTLQRHSTDRFSRRMATACSTMCDGHRVGCTVATVDATASDASFVCEAVQSVVNARACSTATDATPLSLGNL